MKPTVILLCFLSFSSFSQTNLTLLSQTDCDTSWYTVGIMGVGGYVDEFGNEYAIVGTEKGVCIYDITIPSSPVKKIYIPGGWSTWREVGVYNNHAYVSSLTGDGLLIIDLNPLPGTITLANATNFMGDITIVMGSHSLYVSKDGMLYANGSPPNGGVIIYDLKFDPKYPEEMGSFQEWYVHDSYASGDTLFCANITEGFLSVLDISDPINIQVLAIESTPKNFTHNCWLSDNGNYLFTTDEVSGAWIGAYDISDFNNITEIDRIKRSDSCLATPHNTYFINDFLVTAYYSEGITIHDVSYPDNMIEIAHYDTDSTSSTGFIGAWGAFPFFPSGNIIVSDRYNGLFIFAPNYVRAARLQGHVTDAVFGSAINNVNVSMLSVANDDQTDFAGYYSTGNATGGNFQVVFSKMGYVTDTFNVSLINDSVITLDVQLQPITYFSLTGKVIENVSEAGIKDVKIEIQNSVYSYTAYSDLYGNFSFPQIFNDPANTSCNIFFTKWGHETYCDSNVNINTVNSPWTMHLDKGYYDDFSTDMEWQINSTATNGIWERAKPNGVSSLNPDYDKEDDCFDMAFVTENGTGSDNLGLGHTTITSPLIDITDYVDPYINFDLWIGEYNFDSTERGNAVTVFINDGTDILMARETYFNFPHKEWTTVSLRVADFTSQRSGLTIKIQAEDYWNDEPFEAAVDKFRITGEIVYPLPVPTTFMVYPNPAYDVLNFQSPQRITNVMIIDVTGKIVMNKTIGDYRGNLSIDNLANGIYELKAVLENGEFSATKIIKQ